MTPSIVLFSSHSISGILTKNYYDRNLLNKMCFSAASLGLSWCEHRRHKSTLLGYFNAFVWYLWIQKSFSAVNRALPLSSLKSPRRAGWCWTSRLWCRWLQYRPHPSPCTFSTYSPGIKSKIKEAEKVKQTFLASMFYNTWHILNEALLECFLFFFLFQ